MLAAVDGPTVIAGGVVGGVTGGVVVVGGLIIARRLRSRERDRSAAYARWLAARLSLSRASIALVTAFRALHDEREGRREPDDSDTGIRDAPRGRLRIEEAQRARAAWHDARRRLDAAQATVLVRTGSGRVWNTLIRFDRIEGAEIEGAIRGDGSALPRLVTRLRRLDRDAVAFVHGETAVNHRDASPVDD